MALTVIYTNTSSYAIGTSIVDGNLTIAPAGSVSLPNFNASLDYEVNQGKMTRTINGVTDNVTTDDATTVSISSGIYTDPSNNQQPLPLKVGSVGELQISGLGSRTATSITIANGASVTATVDLAGAALVGVVIPPAWTSAALNVEVSADNTNWGVAYDANSTVTGSVPVPTVSCAYTFDIMSLLPWRYIRFRSGTLAVPVNQGAARSLVYVTRPLA